MHRIWGLLARIRAIVHGERADRELDEEISFHLEQEAAKLERGGLSPVEARRRAMVAFGGVAQTHESHRDVRVVRWLADIVADARFALRSLRRAPLIAAAAVITLALGIGTATTIYTVIDTVLLRPLPFPHGERLFMIGEENAERNWHGQEAAPANMLDWREQIPAFTSVAGFLEGHASVTLTGDGASRIVYFAQVTGSFFDVLGVPPELGREFREEETWKQPTAVVIISDRFWRTSLGGDARVIGRSIRLDGVQREIVGVMPPSFAYPYPDVDVWLATGWDPAAREQVFFRRAHFVRTIARIRPTLPEATANLQLQSVVRRLQGQYPETNDGMGASLTPLHDFIIGDARRPLLLLLGAVGLLLLIACANVGNLLLVHAIGRQRELSLRLALGARGARLVRQALTESLVLSLLGGVAGLAVAWAGVRMLGAIQPKAMLPVNLAGIDWRVLLFLVAVTTLCGLAFGIAPAIWGQRQQPADALHEGGRSSSDGMRMRRWGHALVIGEVALALMLTVSAGLLVRSYAALRRVNPGFEPAGVLTVGLQLAGGRYDSLAALSAFDAQMLERVRAMPGVVSAAISSTLPLTGGLGWTSDFSIAGRARDAFATEIAHREVSPTYFLTMRVPLLRGRAFTDADRGGAERVVVVNEALVRRYFRGEDPIGKRIAFDRVPDSTSKWRTIVGVVGNEHQLGLPLDPHDEVFAPLAQDQQQNIVFVVRTSGAPLALVDPIRDAMHDIDPNLAIASTQSMESIVSDSLARDRFLMTLLAVFAAVGLTLAIVGVYGVLAQMTRRRTREMGVRIALGARDAELRWLVISHGLKLVLAGLAVGAMLALVLTRAMQRVLFEVPPSDPVTYVAVALLLAATGAAAAWLPAYRASTTDPAVVLRAE
jgi:putative ABC transport system permease protein